MPCRDGCKRRVKRREERLAKEDAGPGSVEEFLAACTDLKCTKPVAKKNHKEHPKASNVPDSVPPMQHQLESESLPEVHRREHGNSVPPREV